jgi:thiol:disulfide interchange protein DsbC
MSLSWKSRGGISFRAHVRHGKTEDITSGAEAAQPASPAVDFASLPLQHAIKSVHGQGRRTLAVFSDPDCPYCKKLEQELAKVDDVTVYTFLMPLEQLHPDSRAKADAVWCSKDRSAAWSALMLDGKVPKKTKGCQAPHQAVLPLAEMLGLRYAFPGGRRWQNHAGSCGCRADFHLA